ncbi:ComF family protein [Chitinimonas sp. PSY-7]|uniref:double zinc ribbon domain-containing protein n=1 Tax=Chitinimonas sp. PSY-7 TaxID=3459088 RepID=UPI00404031E4
MQRGLDLLLPQHCVLCAAKSGASGLCALCLADMPQLGPLRCPSCAIPTPQGERCGECLQHPPAFDHTIAAWAYDWPLDRLVPAYKYNAELILATPLAEGLVHLVQTAPRPDCLLAMPLHPTRLKERGFNQSQLLASHLAKALQIPLRNDLVERIKLTPPQASLPRDARRTAIKKAFHVRRAVSGMHIALVDDVMTTGASLDELASTLKQAGAHRIDCWVVARTTK